MNHFSNCLAPCRGGLLRAAALLLTLPNCAMLTQDPETALPADIEGVKLARIWRFDADGDSEGWRMGENVAPLEVAQGRLLLQNLGVDPHIFGPALNADATKFQFIGIRARSSAPGLTQIFYNTPSSKAFDAARMLSIPMPGDGQWHFHQIDLRSVINWRGPLLDLRLDPVNGDAEIGASTEIDWIALYQTPAQLEATLPHWIDGERLRIGFENRGGQDSVAPVELRVRGKLVGTIPALSSPGEAGVEIDASRFPATFWLEATLAGTRIWRGRMCKPVEPPRADWRDRTLDARIVPGTAMAMLTRGIADQSVRLAPLASMTLRGPEKACTYYEFAPRPIRDSSPVGLEPLHCEELIVDPLMGQMLCASVIEGTRVNTTFMSSIPVEVLRFEGPRMLQSRPHTHAIFPGLEYLGPGEESSKEAWVGPAYAKRMSPERSRITVPMIAVEYDRPDPEPGVASAEVAAPVVASTEANANLAASTHAESRRSSPWVAALLWDIDNHRGQSTAAPSVEFRSTRAGPSYATAVLPTRPDADANLRYASRPLSLEAGTALDLQTEYRLHVGTIESAYEEFWRVDPPPGPTLAWTADDARNPELPKDGPGSRAAIEKILEISMRAYTQSLYDPTSKGWKSHIAISESYSERKTMRAVVLSESLRSARQEYLDAIESPSGAQLEEMTPSASALVGVEARRAATAALGRMGMDGGVLYELTEKMQEKIEAFSEFHELPYSPFGTPGATNPGLTASAIMPLLEYAAVSRDPIYVAAAERALKKVNSFTVPRGSQTWEIHMQTPDVLASAFGVRVNLWGHRISGDERYLDEALRWARTGLPFFYAWEPPEAAQLHSVQVQDALGEGSELTARDPSLFYADVGRQVSPYASIPVFGTSWFAVPWFGIPVQWCGLAWGNAIRELDEVRPVPHLVKIADGLFRSAANQQADKGYLAGTLPDSWDMALGSSRQPYIVPDRIVEYAYRVLGVPYVDNLQYTRLSCSPWTHIATRALILETRDAADSLEFGARFYGGQNSSALIGCERRPAEVRINGRVLETGRDLWCAQWIPFEGSRGGLVVRWEATGGDDRIEVRAP